MPTCPPDIDGSHRKCASCPLIVTDPLVLVVEDCPDARDSLADLLGVLGFRVETAANGREALLRMHSDREMPCMVVLDLNMPVMCGRDFRRMQLADRNLADVPVVLLSAVCDRLPEDWEALHPTAAFTKPAEPEELINALRRLCRHRQHESVLSVSAP